MNKKQITKSIGIISLSTLLSRILGYIRDSINASLLGAGFVSDAYFTAYRIPNLLRDLLAEGSLSIAFIPTFTEYITKKSKEEVWELASIVFNLLIIIFSFVIIVGILLSPVIVKLIAPGFVSETLQLTITLTRIIFPFIAFMGFGAFFMAILNSYHNFTVSALAPACLNIVMILTGIFICPLFGNTPEKQVIGWSIGALAGGFVQMAVQLPSVLKKGFKYKPLIKINHPGVKKMFGLFTPTLFSSSVNQINILFINTVIASLMGEAAITYLYYGFRLVQLPLGMFGVAVATAIFPLISVYAVEKNIEKFRETISFGMRLVFFITIPAAFGLIALSQPISSLLFRHGRFNEYAAMQTAYAAMCYSFGIFAMAGTKVFTVAFFSLHDSRTPVKIGIAAIILNAALSIICLVADLGFKGLALTNSISAILSFFLLFYFLRKKIGRIDGKRIVNSFIKITIASAAMAFLAWAAAQYINGLLLKVSVSICFGILIFILFSFILRIEELNNVREMFLRKSKENI